MERALILAHENGVDFGAIQWSPVLQANGAPVLQSNGVFDFVVSVHIATVWIIFDLR